MGISAYAHGLNSPGKRAIRGIDQRFERVHHSVDELRVFTDEEMHGPWLAGGETIGKG